MDEPDHIFEGYDANPGVCRHCGAVRPMPCYSIKRTEAAPTDEAGEYCPCEAIGVEDITRITDAFAFRQSHFAEEEPTTSLRVILANYGDHRTEVKCIAGEWSGIKAELTPGSGLPHCPNGHVLTEAPERWRLGLVPDTSISDLLAKLGDAGG